MASKGSGRIRNGNKGDAQPTKQVGGTFKNPEHAKKVEILREIDTLQKRINALEREKSTHLYSKRSEFRKEFGTMEDLENKWLSERRNEKNQLKQNLEKMRHQVDRFQYELKNVKPTPEFVEKLKETMETIEVALNEFKERQRYLYEELMRDEKRLNVEISQLEKRFEQWAKTPALTVPDPKPAVTAAPSKQRSMTDMPPEVAAFERFLQQTGGHQGGWDDYDHGTFLRIRNKHKGKQSFMDEAASSLPGRSITDVKNHEAWYQEYSSLLEKKKDAIQKWRLVKEAKKEEFLNKAEENVKKDSEESTRRAAEKAKRLEEERMERQAKLSAWKVQKELEKAQEEERKLMDERRKMRAFEKEKKRQEEVKLKVHEYMLQRKEEEEFLSQEMLARQEADREEKQKAARQEMERFRERDRRKQEEQLEKERLKQEAERQKVKKLEKLKQQVEVKVKRDPNRLYNLTEGWKERAKAERPESSGPMLSIPCRHMPVKTHISLRLFFRENPEKLPALRVDKQSVYTLLFG